MADKQIVRNGNPPKQQPLPHRQQTAVRVAAAAAPAPKPSHHIPDEASVTASDSSESEISTASKMSSRIEKSGLSKNQELPRKCLVVRRSAPKKGVTKTEIRLVIYNETQKKEGLRKMEYPALMDASEMLADRLRDLETKNSKNTYQKDTEMRRQLEGERRPGPTPAQQKEAIAKLKKVAPSLCNPSSDVTTATLLEQPSASSPLGSIRVEPTKNPHRNRKALPQGPVKKPTVPAAASTTVISDNDLDSWIEELSSSEESEPESKSTSMSVSGDSQVSTATDTTCPEKDCCKQQPCTKGEKRRPDTPKKKKKRSKATKGKRSGDQSDSAPRVAKVPAEKEEPVKKQKKKRLPVVPSDSDDSSTRRSTPSKPLKKEPAPAPSDLSDDSSQVSAKPLRKPPPHAIRELPRVRSKEPVEPADAPRRPKKDQEPPKDEEPKEKMEPSEPRRPKKDRDQPKDEEPKGANVPSEPRRRKMDQQPPKDEEPKGTNVPSEPRRPKKDQEPPKDEEPKGKMEPSEPRRPKKGQEPPKDEEPKGTNVPSEPRRPNKDQEPPKDEQPKGANVPSEPRRHKKAVDPKGPERALVPLCDRRDCCMQQPCVKKGRKEEKGSGSDPDQTDNEPSGKRRKKNKKRTDIVLTDDTSATNNSNIEDSLYVLKRILKKLESSNSLKLKNNPDREKVKAQIEKIIRAVEGKLANGTKLSADDLDRMKRIVAKTAELRGTVSLTTTVTVTESVSVEDEDTN